MVDDKIRISLEDLNQPEVDEKLAQERRLRGVMAPQPLRQSTDPTNAVAAGAPREYGRIAVGPQPGQGVHASTGGLLYSTVFYTCLCGLVMALIAWAVTEPFKDSDSYSEADFERLIREEGYEPWAFILLSETDQEQVLERIWIRVGSEILIESALWFAIIGAIIGLGLASVESLVSRAFGAAARAGLMGVVLGFLGGGVAGFCGQFLYSWLLSMQEGDDVGVQIFARALAWAIAGMVLGAGQGLGMFSGKKARNGLIGGLVGGFLGGLLFDPIGFVVGGDTASRMVGLAAVGALTGAMIGWVENLLKDAWLQVTAGPLTGKQFVVYRNPTVFGSSPKADIYLFKDQTVEPRHALLHTTPQGYVLEDLQSRNGTWVNGQRIAQHRLRSGDTVQLGSYAFAYSERIRQPAPSMVQA